MQATKSSRNMDLIFCKLKKLEKLGFNFFASKKMLKKHDFLLRDKKVKKHELFSSLKKIKKHGLDAFSSAKNSTNTNIFCKLKKLKKHK